MGAERQKSRKAEKQKNRKSEGSTASDFLLFCFSAFSAFLHSC